MLRILPLLQNGKLQAKIKLSLTLCLPLSPSSPSSQAVSSYVKLREESLQTYSTWFICILVPFSAICVKPISLQCSNAQIPSPSFPKGACQLGVPRQEHVAQSGWWEQAEISGGTWKMNQNQKSTKSKPENRLANAHMSSFYMRTVYAVHTFNPKPQAVNLRWTAHTCAGDV